MPRTISLSVGKANNLKGLLVLFDNEAKVCAFVGWVNNQLCNLTADKWLEVVKENFLCVGQSLSPKRLL